jgi:hypothetical protein
MPNYASDYKVVALPAGIRDRFSEDVDSPESLHGQSFGDDDEIGAVEACFGIAGNQ